MIDVEEEAPVDLAAYAEISSRFEVSEAVDVARIPRPLPFCGDLPTRYVGRYTKDYDALDGGPCRWEGRFELAHWAFFVARRAGQRIGGAAVVFDSPEIDMLRGRDDVALLWDIRVAATERRTGAGRALVGAIERWARRRRAEWIEVETQDVNAPACRFYRRCGFALYEANARAYSDIPHEIQLLWFMKLA